MLLPRLVAVYHGSHTSTTAEKMFTHASKLIDELPANSKVGLEMDWSHPTLPLPPRVKALFSDRNFFARLADHAQRKGHEVIWLETPDQFMEMEHGNLDQLERAIERVENANHETPEGSIAIEAAEKAYAQVGVAPTATYRTNGMKSVITKTDWKSTDVAIAGAIHSHQLAKSLKKKVWRHIHPFSKQVYLKGIRQGLIEEKARHKVFLKFKRQSTKLI